MRTSKYISLLIIIGATLFFSQCEVQRLGCIDPQASNYDVTADIDDGSCVYGSFPPYNNCESDFSGNLVVNNQTEFQLVLYNNGVQQTCIPAYDSNFIVNIPNQQLEVCNLQLWKSDDVAEQQPEEDKVFRQWKVALSNTSDESERASWLISNSESWLGTGTIELNYPKIDEYGQSHDYQVDIFLNSKSGAKLASLQGGVSNKLVSVDYGIHVLYFRYWYSNPTNGSVKELGWLEHQGVVLNAQHLDYKVEIPVYQSFEGKYAYMKVINNFEHAVAILADGALIENIAKVEGSTQGLSVIPAKNSTEFLIPMKESYTITVKSAFNSTVYETFTGVNLLQDETTILTTGEGLQSIIVDNKTNESLGVYTITEEYLGLTIPANSVSKKYNIPKGIDSVLFINQLRSFKVGKKVQGTIVIDSLQDYDYKIVNVTQPWEETEPGVYKSFAINHNTTTSMSALASNSTVATLTFEYNVSSEDGYDKFFFQINDAIKVNGISGHQYNAATQSYIWTTVSFELQPGEHNLKWKFVKDATDTEAFEDRVMIRNIKFE